MRRILDYCLVLLATILLSSCKREQTLNAPTVFHRVTQDDGQLKLESASIRLATNDGTEITLIGVVHLAQREYYDDLNRQLRDFDVVLYEMLGKSADAPLPPLGETRQDRVLKERLGLVRQRHLLDYHPDHFVHADLEASALPASSPKPSNPALLDLLAGEDSPQIRRQKLLSHPEQWPKLFTGDHDSSMNASRHALVSEILREQLSHGKRKIAVLYGTAHLPDLLKRLPPHEILDVSWSEAWPSQE